jgi:hypothetical protein
MKICMFEIICISDSVVQFMNAAVSPSLLSLCVLNVRAFQDLSFYYITLVLHFVGF